MYEVFDSMLSTPTWHTRDTFDEERFYQALNKIVWMDDFEPDDLRQYMRDKAKIAASDDESEKAEAIDRYTQDAWAVVDFIRYGNVSKA
jgi:hypothetical protein